MAVSSISPSNRAVTAPEASRPAPVSRPVAEQPRKVENVTKPNDDAAQKLQQALAKLTAEDSKRTSRENKDNGNNQVDLYQAPGLKQSQPKNKQTGTLVNVTA